MMKFIKLGIVSIVSILAIAACNTGVDTCIDPETGEICEPPPIPQYPTLIKLDSIGYLVDDIFVQPSEEIHILLKGTRGDSLLTNLEVRENGELLVLNRMTIDGAQLGSNPYRFTVQDTVFIWDVGLIVQDTRTKVQYEFILEDESQRQAITDIIVNTDITAETPPVIELLENTASTLGAGIGVFRFDVDAIGSPIESITVYQASELVGVNRLKFDGVPFASNPLPLEGSDRNGFVKDIEITSSEEFILQGYTVIFLDALGTTNADAEIKDSGSQGGIWNQKITAFNGSELTITYADIDTIETKQDIKEEWNKIDPDKRETVLSSMSPDEYTTSIRVRKDSTYIVKRLDDYYMFKIDSVDVTAQSYILDLKK